MRARAGRGRRALVLAAVAALAVVVSATAGGSAIPVTLKLTGSADRTVGQSARLTATAKVPSGDRLLILADRSGKPGVKVAECLRSPCTGTFRDTTVEVVDFQAFVIKRTAGKLVKLGSSNRVSVSWTQAPPPPPPPPPPAAATPGHYEGKTSQNEIFKFDVTADGRGIANLETGQINESCDPPGSLYGGNIRLTIVIPVALDGTFTETRTYQDFVGTLPATEKETITGRVANGVASGTLRNDTTYTKDGHGVSCSTSDQTWTATKV